MSRRGAALLLVLGALLVVTTAVSTSMLSATNALRGDHVHQAELQAADLLHASEVIADRWLRTESSRAVVDPALPEPRLTIADIEHDAHDLDTSIKLTAWDLLGMPSAELPASHPLSRFVLLDADSPRAQSLAELADPETPVHPEAETLDGRLGGIVAVHPRDPPARSTQSAVINVNTAPEPLLAAAMRLGQRGDVASVLASRQRGVPSPAPTASRDASSLVTLTARSNRWAVRADITVGPVTRSWWTVYESRGRGWSIIDRHEIAG